MPDVTEAMVEAAFRGEPDAVAQLVTIRSEGLDEPLNVTDWPGGLTSNGVEHVHYPFQLSWAGASQDSPFGQARLTIANVDQVIEAAADAPRSRRKSICRSFGWPIPTSSSAP
jgi:hypothetical protein